MTSHKGISPLSALWPHLGLFPAHVRGPAAWTSPQSQQSPHSLPQRSPRLLQSPACKSLGGGRGRAGSLFLTRQAGQPEAPLSSLWAPISPKSAMKGKEVKKKGVTGKTGSEAGGQCVESGHRHIFGLKSMLKAFTGAPLDGASTLRVSWVPPLMLPPCPRGTAAPPAQPGIVICVPQACGP